MSWIVSARPGLVIIQSLHAFKWSINSNVQWLKSVAAMWRETQNDHPIFPGRVDCLQHDVTFVIVHHNDCWVVLENIHMLNEMLQHNDKQFTVHPPGRCGKAKAIPFGA